MKMLATREFWVAILVLLVMIVGQFMPGFQMDVESAAAAGAIVLAYLIGIAVDPGPGGWKGVIQSRKFYAALFGLVFIFLDAFGVKLPIDLTPEILVTLASIVGGLIANASIQGPPAQFKDPAPSSLHDEAGR